MDSKNCCPQQARDFRKTADRFRPYSASELRAALLREMVAVEGEVVVSGRINHLAITKRSRAASILQEESLSDEELEELARLEL